MSNIKSEKISSTIFAIIFYCTGIVVLIACTVGVLWRLVILPPCTQVGNNCLVDGWSLASLAGTVLAVAATLLAILGAVAVAAWWTSLNKLVTKRVNKLYSRQRLEIDAKIEMLLEQQKQRINVQIADFQTKLQTIERNAVQIQIDLEQTLAESFAATGPFLSEPVLQRAMSQGKLPAFPYYMVKGYIAQFKEQLPKAEAVLENEKRGFQQTQTFVQRDFPFNPTGVDEMSARKYSLMNLQNKLNNPSLFPGVSETFYECDRAIELLEIATNNRGKTLNLTDKDFSQLQNDLDVYHARVKRMKQNIEQMKADIDPLLQRIDDYLKKKL